MTKLLTISLIFVNIFWSTNAFTQEDEVRIGVAGALGLPLGDLEKKGEDKANAGLGFAGLLDLTYVIQAHIRIGLETGYFTFSEKQADGIFKSRYSMIPVNLVGMVDFTRAQVKPYIRLSLGFTTATIHQDDVRGREVSGAEFLFNYSFGLGADYAISEHVGLAAKIIWYSVLSKGTRFDFDGFSITPQFNAHFISLMTGFTFAL